MSFGRARIACAAATAFAALCLPASAGAHHVDCDGNAVTAPPTAADWTGGSATCRVVPARDVAAAGPQVRSVSSAAPANAKTGTLSQVGHEPLLNRGMNAAIAIQGRYVYVGSRTDAHPGTPHGGLLVVDVKTPSHPKLVAGPLDAKPGESTRELRVWRSQNILISLQTNCGVGPTLHQCTTASVSNIRFYDIAGANARRPLLIRQFDVDTHEFFLWEDPANPARALIFAGNAGSTCAIRGGAPSCPFSVWDISGVRQAAPTTLYSGLHGYTQFPPPPDPVQKPTGGLHSLTVTNDGSRAFFALLNGGFAIVDVSEFAAGKPLPQPHPITANADRPTWAGPGAHSAIKLWGRNWAWVSDEVYGSFTGPDHGCPWGWARIVDVSDPTKPQVKAEYREPENDPNTCQQWNPPKTSYSAHNPTLTPNIAFSTWHSGGVQAISLENPRKPYQLAEFTPKPLSSVLLEDPRLSSDPDTGRNEKVVMWSYPIIQNGLIYVVDLRNGLYVLRYSGALASEVDRIHFLEGNSNQGDALCYEPVGQKPASCG